MKAKINLAKLLPIVLCAFSLCVFVSCSDEESERTEIEDNEGPEIYEARWIRVPAVENDPEGNIVAGGNYTISLQEGFHLKLGFRDLSDIESGYVYFLVNDNPEIRENIIYEGTVFNYQEGALGYVHQVKKISLGVGEFYNLQVGDKYHFYASLSDVHGNTTTMTWTADLVE